MKGWRLILLPALLAVGALLVVTLGLGDGTNASPALTVELDAQADGTNTYCNPVDDIVSGISGSHKVAVCAMDLPAAVGAFQFDVIYDSSLNECPEVADSGTALDDNPDANAGSTTFGVGDDLGTGWDCSGYGFAYPVCDHQLDLTDPYKAAYLGCLSTSGPWTLGDDELNGVLGVVSFNVVGQALDTMTLAGVVVGDPSANELGSCNPYVTTQIECYGAEVDKSPPPTPTNPCGSVTCTPTPPGEERRQPTITPTPTESPVPTETSEAPPPTQPPAPPPPPPATATPFGGPGGIIVPPPTGSGGAAGGASLWLMIIGSLVGIGGVLAAGGYYLQRARAPSAER